MSLWRLIAREILHRKLNFAIGVLSVVAAVACLTGALTALRAHDARTRQIIASKEAEMRQRMQKLEDDYRKIMKKLGFNVLILPKDQNLADMYAEDYASKYMPEEYADKLANSGIMTVRHLLPILQQKLKWPERKRTIILVGTRGEVPVVHRAPKEPLLVLVAPGTLVVGYELHQSLSLSVGQTVQVLGKEFTITKCQPERGNKDDITLWMNLTEVQELLHKEGKINSILALECYCPDPQLANIRREISRVLPDTQVIEFATRVVIRAEARRRAAVAARDEIKAEKTRRNELRREREGFANILVPLVVVGCIIWIGFLAFGNVSVRRFEIGILMAIGLRARQVFSVFLAKAALMGLVGGLVGYFVGFGVGSLWGETPGQLFDPGLLVLVIVAAPLLACLAGLIPAMLAAGQDPAVVLTEE